MRTKNIVFNGDYRVVEREFVPVKKDEVLVKPLSIYLGLFERNSYNYKYYMNTPITPCSFGVVRVLEEPYINRGASGNLIIVNPVYKNKILGLDQDGLCSTYAHINYHNIYQFLGEFNPYYALKPLIDHVYYIISKISGNVLVLGCNILSYIFEKLTRTRRNIISNIYCGERNRVSRRFFKHVLSNIGELRPEYDYLVIFDPRYSIFFNVMKKIRTSRIVISGYSLINNIVLQTPGAYRVVFTFKTRRDPLIAEKIFPHLKKAVRTVRVDDIEKIPGLLDSTHELGIVVLLEH